MVGIVGTVEQPDVFIIGAGYSGMLLSNILVAKGYEILIAKSSLESEIQVFSRLEVVSSHYKEFIDEYYDFLPQLSSKILRTTVLRTTKKEKWEVEALDYKLLADNVFVCTGCYDKRPFTCKIFGTRPAGIFSLQNALDVISRGYRIGKNILLFGVAEMEIFGVIEEMLTRLGYECQIVGGGEVEVVGKERVEEVVIDGEKFGCDTLVHYCGREEFNPFRLNGIKAGNIAVKTYDYGKIRRNVLKVSKKGFKT